MPLVGQGQEQAFRDVVNIGVKTRGIGLEPLHKPPAPSLLPWVRLLAGMATTGELGG
jgi:hypothetical protein